jgi:hypothetical protein
MLDSRRADGLARDPSLGNGRRISLMAARSGQPSLSPNGGVSTQIYTVVPEPLKNLIDRAADDMDVSRSDVVRDALVFFLVAQEKCSVDELKAAIGRPMLASQVIRRAIAEP